MNRPVDRHRRTAALREANRARRRYVPWGGEGRRRADWLAVGVVAVLLFLLLRTFVVAAFRIPSSSMERTLLEGDFLLVNRFLYGAEVPLLRVRLPAVRAPRRDEVIVFDWPVDPGKPFVKRLVGLPGDTLAMQDGVLWRNGQRQQESYVRLNAPRTTRDAPFTVAEGAVRDRWGPVVVPPRHYFVLGDNRTNSLDSRYWGFVPDSLLRGTPWIVYYSYAPDSADPLPWLTRIRWARIGTLVR